MRRNGAAGSVWTIGLMMVASFFLVAAGCGDKTVLSAASIGDLEVSEQVSFKRTAVGETDTQRVVFKNDATPETGGSVRVSDWRFAQPDGEVPVYEPAEPDDFPDRKETVNLAPGESVSFELMYSPKPGAESQGELLFEVSGDPTWNESPARVDLLAPDVQPELGTSPSTELSFASAVGEVDREYVNFQNIGTDVMRVEDLSVDNSGPFDVSFAAPDEINCRADGAAMFQSDASGDDVPLADVETVEAESGSDIWPVDGVSERYAPDGCLVAIIEFRPDAFPPTPSTLTLSTERAGEVTIELRGNFGEPCLEVAPSASIDFGAVEVGRTTTETVRLRNCRPEADELRVTSVEFANTSGVFGHDGGTLDSGLQDGNPNTGIDFAGSDQDSMVVQATPDGARRFGRADCNPETDPVFQVYHNGVGSEDGPRELCLTVVGDRPN